MGKIKGGKGADIEAAGKLQRAIVGDGILKGEGCPGADGNAARAVAGDFAAAERRAAAHCQGCRIKGRSTGIAIGPGKADLATNRHPTLTRKRSPHRCIPENSLRCQVHVAAQRAGLQ